MTAEQIRNWLTSRPFRPFVLRTADGERIAVRHPEMAMLTPGGRTLFVATGDESVEILDVLLITAIELDGRRKRRQKGR